MRSRHAALTLLILLLALPRSPAGAQDVVAEVELTLTQQTPVITPKTPLQVAVSARHVSGPPLGDLTLSLWVYNPARSRSAYQQGLTSEPPTAPLLITPTEIRGRLGRGETREFSLGRALTPLQTQGENALYPIKVQLESEGVAVAEARSAVVYVQQKPLVPLNLSAIFVLDPEIRFTPDGALVGAELEEAIASGGWIAETVSELEDNPTRTTLVVAPLLVEWLARMGNGYRVVTDDGVRHVGAGTGLAEAATRMLERIRQLARATSVEVVPLPYASPSLPALVGSRLQEDLSIQIQEGRAVVERILGVSAPSGLLRPPGAALSHGTIPALVEAGIGTVILDSGTVRAPLPPGSTLSPLPTVRLRRGVTGIVPDADVTAYVGSGSETPIGDGVRLIGELAALYFEQPSVLRGVAIVIDEGSTPPPALLRPLLRLLSAPPTRAAWLRPVKATQLAEVVPPDVEGRLRPHRPPLFSDFFVEELEAARDSIAQFESMADEDIELPDRLRRLLLAAESPRFLTDQGSGLAFVRRVRESLDAEYRKIGVPSRTAVTLTSHGGVIPVTLSSDAGYPVRIRITLRSPRLEFLEGSSRELVLDGDAQSLTFPVRAQTTGRFPVRILVDTPAGRRIDASRIVVRSTAYNRVALFVTAAAAVFLALWWGRRFLRQRMV